MPAPKALPEKWDINQPLLLPTISAPAAQHRQEALESLAEQGGADEGLGRQKGGPEAFGLPPAMDPALQSTCSLTFSRKLPPPQPETLS